MQITLASPLEERKKTDMRLEKLYGNLGTGSTLAEIIISVALMLFLGFAMTRITKKLRLPNVTAYIITGVLIGPYLLDLIPPDFIRGTDFLADIALAFIAFSVGEFFKFSSLKKSGMKSLIITLFEALTASLLVFAATYLILGMDFAFSLVLSALAASTAPASTMMTIRQTGAKGDFVETLLQVVAMDDVVGLVAYSLSISLAVTLTSPGQGGGFAAVVTPILKNLLMLAVGGGFAYLLILLMPPGKRSNDNRLIISVGVLFLFCGICVFFDVSPLLGCMAMGTVYINISDDDRLFKQLNYFSPPLLLLFFVRSGLSFDLSALVGSSGNMGRFSLLTIGVVYFAVRMIGKYSGAYLGCLVTGKKKEVRNYLGLALVPQAGVAIGLAALCVRSLGPDIGGSLQTIILSSSFLYELIGPASAKLALYLSRSYSNDIDEATHVSPVREDGTRKSEVDILAEQLREIQKEIKENENRQNENENAFIEAFEEMQLAQDEYFGSVKRGRFLNKR